MSVCEERRQNAIDPEGGGSRDAGGGGMVRPYGNPNAAPRPMTPEHKRKIAAAMKGKKKTRAQREAISRGLRNTDCGDEPEPAYNPRLTPQSGPNGEPPLPIPDTLDPARGLPDVDPWMSNLLQRFPQLPRRVADLNDPAAANTFQPSLLGGGTGGGGAGGGSNFSPQLPSGPRPVGPERSLGGNNRPVMGRNRTGQPLPESVWRQRDRGEQALRRTEARYNPANSRGGQQILNQPKPGSNSRAPGRNNQARRGGSSDRPTFSVDNVMDFPFPDRSISVREAPNRALEPSFTFQL